MTRTFVLMNHLLIFDLVRLPRRSRSGKRSPGSSIADSSRQTRRQRCRWSIRERRSESCCIEERWVVFLYRTRCHLSFSGPDNGDASKSGKKKDDPGAPQWKRQPREVIDPIVYSKSILSIILILESTEAEISLPNLGRCLERTNNEISEEQAQQCSCCCTTRENHRYDWSRTTYPAELWLIGHQTPLWSQWERANLLIRRTNS